MASVGAVWQFRYNSSSSSSYKWEFVGGTSIQHSIETHESLPAATATYSDLSTVGPRIKVGLTGEYSVFIAANSKHNVNGGVAYMSYAVGSTAAGSGEEWTAQYNWTNFTNSAVGIFGNRTTIKVATAGDELVAKYRNNDPSSANNPIASFDRRRMIVVPVRVQA